MKYQDLIEKINKHGFYGLSSIDVGAAMYCCLKPMTGNKTDIWTSLLRIIVYLITIDVDYDIKESGEIAFVYSNSYKNRSDHHAIMTRLVTSFSSYLYFKPGKKKAYLRNLRFLRTIIKWYKSFALEFPCQESVYYTSMLLFGITNADYIISKITKDCCKKVVVFSDMHLIDSLVVQKCNVLGLKTITLQHGNFEVFFPFVLSKSNYFITYGKYSEKIAIEAGMDPNRLKIAGMLRMIGKNNPEHMETIKKIDNIGVIFSGYNDREKDVEMYNICKEYCETKDVNLFVKMHPHFGKENYNEIDWSFPKGAYCDEISIEEFKEKISIAVVYSSTVFVEYIMALFPVLLFDDGERKYYRTIDWCRFTNAEGMEDLVKMITKEPHTFADRLEATKHLFSENNDILKSYKETIQSL